MELRVFTTEDTAGARKLFQSRAGTFFDPSEIEDFEETLEFIRDPGDAPERAEFWAGWIDGAMVAFGGIEWIGEAGYLCWGTVDPAVAGRGCGRQLLHHRLDRLRAVGVGSVFSDTTQLTEGFYARHGFVTYFREAHHFGRDLHLAAMELSFDGVRRGPRRVRPDGTLGYGPDADPV